MTDPKILYRVTEDDMTAWSEGNLAEMIRWAEVNGLVPKDVRSATGFTIEEIDDQRWIRYQRFIRNEAGHIQIRPDSDEPLSTEELVPMVFMLPAWVRRAE